MELSYISALLVTHSRFSDVYSLFEETLELLPEATVKDFMHDVSEIRTKLDTWKSLLTYEKEKKTFLVEKCHARSGTESQSGRDSKDAASQHGSSSNDSVSTTLSHRPPSEHRRSASMNNASPIDETLQLVLESDSDETWLLAAPMPVPVPQVPKEKTENRDSLRSPAMADSPKQQQQQPSNFSPKPLSTKPKPSLRTRIPKPPLSPNRPPSRGALSSRRGGERGAR